jgi:hypothetical protein
MEQTVFRNVGTQNSNAGGKPKKEKECNMQNTAEFENKKNAI